MGTKSTNVALLHACRTIRALLARASRNEIRDRYRVGALISLVRHTPGTYGEHAMERLAAELGQKASSLYRYTQVAETWSEKDVDELASRTNKFGAPLSWSHLVALTDVRDAATRQALADKCLAEGWTVRKLGDCVKDAVSESPLEEDPGVETGGPARVALQEGIGTAMRAAHELDVFAKALEARLADLDLKTDEALIARAIAALETLHARAESTLDKVRGMRRTSRTRIRVVSPAPTEEVEAERGTALEHGSVPRGYAPSRRS